MRSLLLVSLLVLVSSCTGKISSNLPVSIKKEESLKIDVFSLTYHKQLGTCAALPISHRVLVFNPIWLSPDGSDFFVGSMEVLLDETAKTYQALYTEWPGSTNIDQNVFTQTFSGSFEVIKAQGNKGNDKMILNNLGVINPTLKSDRVKFLISFDADINREITHAESMGLVLQKGTALIDDNCLL